VNARPLLLLVLGCLAADTPEPERGYLGMKVGTRLEVTVALPGSSAGDGRSPEGPAKTQIEVSQVFLGSHAEAAGLQEGDTLLSVDGHPLQGLTVKEAVDLLTGPMGSRAVVERDPFPPGGGTERLKVLRGPRPAEGEAEGRSMLPPVEREANMLVGALRAGRPAAVDTAAKVWAEAAIPAEADRALLRALREADATGWTQRLGTEPIAAFWGAVATSAPLLAWLADRPLPTRARVAGLLARHAASAPAVAALLPEPVPGEEGAAAKALAAAVLGGDPTAIAATGWTPPDLWGPTGGLVLGPRAGDLAALEWCAADSASGRPAGLPEASAVRLEATGMRLPWERAATGRPFAVSEAPVVQPFTATATDGSTLDLAAHQGPVVLAFWATWCGPCRQELPHLQTLREAHRAAGLEVWALSTDRPQDREKIPGLWAEWGLTLPVAPAPGALVQAWDVRSVPRVVVLDGEHRRVLDHQGFSEESFAELEEQVQAVLQGSLKGQRTLGQLEGQLHLLATGSLPGKPKALVRTPDGGVEVLSRGALTPLTLEGETLQAGLPRRLPLTADQASWADLDADGQAELLLADGEVGTLRVSDADGAARWTRRGDPIGGFGVLRGGTDGALVVTLRATEDLQDPPSDARGVASGERVRVPRHHLEILGPDGALRADLPLPTPTVAFAPAPDGHAVALALADGEVLVLGPDLVPSPVMHPLDRPRGLAWDGDGLWIAGGSLRGLLVGRGAEAARWRLAETGGGDLWALDPRGEVTARLDLQRPVLLAIGDLQGDAVDEVVLWAPWFGVAVLQP